MCYEYGDWAWQARVAELAKRKRKLPEAQEKPQHTEQQPEAAPEVPSRERATAPA
jgi:hypothetical protein